MRLGDIRLNSKNPRKISSAAIALLKKSIERDPAFMLLRPIVVDETGMILGGNQRYRAICEIGMSEIPDGWVVRTIDLSDEKLRRFVIVDNGPDGMCGSFDMEMLVNEWDESQLFDTGVFNCPEKFNHVPSDNQEIDEEAMRITAHECPECKFKW